MADEARAIADVTVFDTVVGVALLPWTNLLLRSESSASSRIERLTSSARKVVEQEYFGEAGGNATLIVANANAMREAIALDDPLDVDAILTIHRTLLQRSAPDIAGKLREEPV